MTERFDPGDDSRGRTDPPETPPVIVGYGGFWLRAIALVIDAVLLGFLGSVLGYIFFDEFASLGQHGRWVGLIAAGLYFAVQNSRFGDGQTIGKRIVAIQVVDEDRLPISISRAATRFAIPAFPWALNGLVLPAGAPWVLGLLIAVAIYAIPIVTLYLLVFNRPTRRTLHDFAAKSVVVRKRFRGTPRLLPLGRKHRVALGVLGVVLTFTMVALTAFFASVLPKMIPGYVPDEVMALRSELQQEFNTNQVGVWDLRLFVVSGRAKGSTRRTLSVVVATTQKPTSYEAVADDIARVVLDAYPRGPDRDAIVITVTYGFNILIAQRASLQRFSHSPDEWRERVDPSP